MHRKSNPFLYAFIGAQLLICLLFVGPLWLYFDDISMRTLFVGGTAVAIAALLIRVWPRQRWGRQLGRQIVYQAAAFWGVGWSMMVLFDQQMGWIIFIISWLILTVGLFMSGTADYTLRQPIGWPTLPLLAGILPPLVAVSHVTNFTQLFEPFVQLQLMFLFAAGWVFQGVLLTHNKLPVLEKLQEAAAQS